MEEDDEMTGSLALYGSGEIVKLQSALKPEKVMG